MRLMRAQQGFTALELALVISLISLLAIVGVRHYLQALEGMRAVSVQTLANQFQAALSNVRAEWMLRQLHPRKSTPFVWNETEVYLNELGWPANTNKRMSARSDDQTAIECWQLWQLFLPSQKSVGFDGVHLRGDEIFFVTAPTSSLCHFELVSEKLDEYYFEYEANTGRISIKNQFL